VSVRWVEGSTYYEHSDWAAHDWERRVSGGDESRGSHLQWGDWAVMPSRDQGIARGGSSRYGDDREEGVPSLTCGSSRDGGG